MLNLIEFNLPLLVVALLIGVAAGRWIFARRPPPVEPTEGDKRPS